MIWAEIVAICCLNGSHFNSKGKDLVSYLMSNQRCLQGKSEQLAIIWWLPELGCWLHQWPIIQTWTNLSSNGLINFWWCSECWLFTKLRPSYPQKKVRLMFLMFLRVFKSFYVRYSPCQSWLSKLIPLRLSTHTTTSIDLTNTMYWCLYWNGFTMLMTSTNECE